jgi:hypothetical protein
MALTVRTPTGDSVSGSSITVTKPSGTVDDDVLYACVVFPADAATIGAVTDPAGWTRLASSPVDSTTGFPGHSAILLRKVAASEGASYTWTWGSTFKVSAIVVAIEGADTATPEDAIASGVSATATTAHVAPTISPSETSSLLLCWFTGNNPGAGITASYSAASGMTEQRDQPAADGGFNDGPYLAVNSQQLSVSGATGTRTATSTESQKYVCFSVAVQAASGSADSTVSPDTIEATASIELFGAEVVSSFTPTALAIPASLTTPSLSTLEVIAGLTLLIEVAFEENANSDDPVWTDISDTVRELETVRGRQSELEQPEPGSLVLRLDNSDRRYDPFNEASPYYPYVEPMRQVRVRAVWEGVTYELFRGFVDSWPQSWPGQVDAECAMSATDAFKVFAKLDLPENAWHAQMQALDPQAWYQFSETGEATVAVDATGNGYDGIYENTPTLGLEGIMEEPGSDKGFSPAHNVGGQRMLIEDPEFLTGYPVTFSAVFRVEENRGSYKAVAYAIDGNTEGGLVALAITSDAFISPTWGGVFHTIIKDTDGNYRFAYMPSGTKVDDGERHHVVCIWQSAENVDFYLDGVATSVFYQTVGTGAPEFPLLTRWAVGNTPKVSFGDFGFADEDTDIIDDFAVWPTALSADDALALADAMRGWEDDLPGERIDKVLDFAGWPALKRDVDEGQTVLANASFSGSVLDYLLKVSETENGNLYVDAEGVVRFRERHAVFSLDTFTDSQHTFGDGPGELPYADMELAPSDAHIRNTVTVQKAGGTPFTLKDETSRSRYLIRGYNRTGLLHSSDNDSRSTAEWILAHYAQPFQRVTTLSTFPQNDDALWPAVLGSELETRITVVRRPPGGGDPITHEAHIERVTHRWAAPTGVWSTTLELSPADTRIYALWDGNTDWDGTAQWGY